MYVVLDSTFLIDLLAGDPGAVDRMQNIFESEDDPCVNDVIVCEVRSGLHDRDVDKLERLLLSVEFVQPGPNAAMLAGQWQRESRQRGFVLSLGDSLIAAVAEGLRGAVLTRNVRDFGVTPVRVETY